MQLAAMNDGWVFCDLGHQHWGRAGAAGLLLLHDGYVLLAQRSAEVSYPHTWGIPGGAIGRGETARAAALREAYEETGLDPRLVRVTDESTVDHGGWAFTTVTGRLRSAGAPALLPLDAETARIEWFPQHQIPAVRDLHPGLRALLN